MSKKGIITTILLVVIIIALVLVVGVIVLDRFMSQGPKLSEVEYLKEPQIVKKEKETVISVTYEGVPGEISGKAIQDLYMTYYKLDVDKSKPVAPKARWTDFETDKKDLKGEFAMTVPNSVTSLPKGSKVELKTWEYGEVAEILHVGSYDSETSTIEKLKKFIADQGYEIIGSHEEEYLKGPGLLSMFGMGSDDDLLTIIRYQVRKE